MVDINKLTAIKPMLCKIADKAFNDPNYIWEPKLDGARIIAVIKDGKVRLLGRSGAEKTHLFPDLKFDIPNLTTCVLDGEVISGSSFNDLQHRVNRVNGINQAIKDYPAKYSVFDLLQMNDIVISGFPLQKRKEILQLVVKPTENVTLTGWTGMGVEMFDLMQTEHSKGKDGTEGVVGKDLRGTYQENKREWLKVKCWQDGLFIVVGYTQGTGWRASSFGALVLSDMNGKYVGEVGTGFTDEDIKNLTLLFSGGHCPFPREPERATWIKPFPIKVRYLEYTNDGKLRFPSFKGVING
jgi:bifunctional non-homologous end joining protein LigD